MAKKRKPASHPRLMAEASHAALGGARALTSHIKCLYDEKYCRRYRMPRLVFSFDAVLVFVVLSLAALLLSLWLRPIAPPTLTASFSAPAIMAANRTPVEVDLRTLEGRTHENVRLDWHLPPGAEILMSEPPISSDGSVFLGTVRPNDVVSSRLVVRFFYPAGGEANVGFTIRSDEGGQGREYVGTETRGILKSALTARVPDLFRVQTVPSDGGVIPIEVANESDLTLPFVELRPGEESGIAFPRFQFGDLSPGEHRYAFIRLGKLAGPPSLRWSVFSASRELDHGSWSAGIAERPFATIDDPLIARPDSAAMLHVTAQESQSLLVVQPLLDEPVQTFPLKAGENSVTVPAVHTPVTPVQEWYAFPLRIDAAGRRELGPGTRGIYVSSFPVSAQVRYTSEAGDQLGIGPNPPQAGKETRYWVFWTLGPFDGNVRNVSVIAELAPGIRATGLIAAPDGGTWSVGAGQRVSWELPAFGGRTGLTKAVFGFEISLVPSARDAGRIIPLLGQTMVRAEDPGTNALYEATDTPKQSATIGF